MNSNNIFKKTVGHVTNMFNEYPNPNLIFHNLEHTQNVVARAEEIAAHYQLPESDMQALFISAWFHDTGHLLADPDKHEEKSVEQAKEFLQQEGVEEDLIKKIEECIMATRMPHEPKSLIQEIMCDADTYHFGTDDFKKTNKVVKNEYELRNYQPVLFDWEKNTLDLLENHTYFTSYCKVLLEEGKQKNIERARKKYLKLLSETDTEEQVIKGPQSKQKNSLITRGIQTMLRLTSENHLELSNMADGKANILISVNSIIISVILSVLVRKLEVDKHLTIPTIIFLISSVTTIVIAILATRPKISEGRFSKTDIISKRTNLLFFGNFYKSTLEEYQWAMSTMMRDKDYLYGSLIQDIHQLGVVLGRKYRLIRVAYNVFMIGIVVSVISFWLAVALHKPTETTVITPSSSSPL